MRFVAVTEDEDVEACRWRIDQAVDESDPVTLGIYKCHLRQFGLRACEVVVPTHRHCWGDGRQHREDVRADVSGVKDQLTPSERRSRVSRQFAMGIGNQSNEHTDSVARANWRPHELGHRLC